MIVTLRGTLTETTPLSAVIEAHGIGYEVNIPVTTTEKLPPVGETVALHTLAVYREDAATLYGFHSREDRDFFRLMVEKVSGIGPRIALSIFSKLSVTLLKSALASSDTALLAQCPGIGKKTAERMIIELKDKILPGSTEASTSAMPSNSQTGLTTGDTRIQDAVNALLTLGYKATEADKAVRRALTKVEEDASTETLIKAALS